MTSQGAELLMNMNTKRVSKDTRGIEISNGKMCAIIVEGQGGEEYEEEEVKRRMQLHHRKKHKNKMVLLVMKR